MSRTLKNGKIEKYNKVSIFGGGNVTAADKRNLKAYKKKLKKEGKYLFIQSKPVGKHHIKDNEQKART